MSHFFFTQHCDVYCKNELEHKVYKQSLNLRWKLEHIRSCRQWYLKKGMLDVYQTDRWNFCWPANMQNISKSRNVWQTQCPQNMAIVTVMVAYSLMLPRSFAPKFFCSLWSEQSTHTSRGNSNICPLPICRRCTQTKQSTI